MEPLVPDRKDEIGIADDECAGKMHGVGTPETMGAGKLACMTLDLCRQLDRSNLGPVVVPRPFCRDEVGLVETVVAPGRCKCSAHLGIREAAREGCISAAPHGAAGSLPFSSATSFTTALESK